MRYKLCSLTDSLSSAWGLLCLRGKAPMRQWQGGSAISLWWIIDMYWLRADCLCRQFLESHPFSVTWVCAAICKVGFPKKKKSKTSLNYNFLRSTPTKCLAYWQTPVGECKQMFLLQTTFPTLQLFSHFLNECKTFYLKRWRAGEQYILVFIHFVIILDGEYQIYTRTWRGSRLWSDCIFQVMRPNCSRLTAFV